MEKEYYMRRALELAKKGEGHTSPNPMVGCVVVKDGKIISEGYHEKYGEFHAERNALLKCGEEARGADLYVTLEPCCHYGKTPPCTDIIIEKGIRKVYAACLDSNPLVAGKGVQILRDHGIEVEVGLLEKESRELNAVFFHYMETGMPYLAMKYAMTLDGKIACATGDSRWVTGEEARRHVHGLRKKYKGIMAGIGTVLADDPLLNCRIEKGVDPVRIICDSSLQIPMDSQLVKTAGEIPLIVACREHAIEDERHREKRRALENAGVSIITTTGGVGVNLHELLRELAKRGIDGILLEGGSTLNGSALEAGLVDRVYAYISGKLVGGADAPSPIAGLGVEKMSEAVRLKNLKIEKLGEDFCISGDVDGAENCKKIAAE